MSTRDRTLWLVRHGDTIWSDSGGIAGRSDIDLSEKGRARVTQLGGTMTQAIRAAHWYSSPMLRTRETARLLRGAPIPATVEKFDEIDGTGSNRVPSLDERLVELDFGDWEGCNWARVHELQGDVLAAWAENWVTTAPPGGESFAQQYRRCAAWLNDWESACKQSSRPADSAVVVTHGGCIRALLCRLLGLPLEEAMRWSVDLGCIFRFTWSAIDPHWRLRAANHTSF